MNKTINLFQIIRNIIAWIFLAIFIVGIIMTTLANVNLLGGYRPLIVQSGSMEPTIMTGDVIVIATAFDYQKNDVVTFLDPENGVITHRIIETKNTTSGVQFVTKGDANRTQDESLIIKNQIMGKTILKIPRLGYFINFTRTKIGMIIFLFIPAFLIVVDEIISVFRKIKVKSSSENRH